jgi:hypothetical protein
VVLSVNQISLAVYNNQYIYWDAGLVTEAAAERSEEGVN